MFQVITKDEEVEVYAGVDEEGVIQVRSDKSAMPCDILATFGCKILDTKEGADLANDYMTKTVWEAPSKKEAKQRFVQTTLVRYKEEKVKAIIKWWEGIVDEKKNPIECNDKNKLLVWRKNTKLINAVIDEIDDIAEAAGEAKRGEEKNFGKSAPQPSEEKGQEE